MKITSHILVLPVLLMITGCSFAQQINFLTKPWKATVKVVGEDGQPINGANVVVGFFLPPYSYSDDPQYIASINGVTDMNGIFFATHNGRTGEIGFSVSKQGCYETRRSYTLRDPEENANDRDVSLTLILKKIGKPIAMYGKWVQRWPVKTDAAIGYDLMAGDWIPPYGKGVSKDIIFTRNFDKKTKTDYDYKLTVSFPKTGDGIQEFTVPDAEKGSILRSPHEAPADGYQGRLTRENFHHPGQSGQADYDPNRIYFFRVRTALDVNGNVVSALYGKIYGDPEQMNFHYYLNPTPNSRNIEFDPKQNLLGGLQSFEGVSAP